MKINLLCIATGKYKMFINPLLEGVRKYFFVNHKVDVHLFIDEIEYECFGDERVKIIKELIPNHRFPFVSLYRYKYFTCKTYECDYLFYSDIDMKIVDFIDESILGNIIAVRHPGFDKVGGGSWETNELSTAYVFPENRIAYYAGGFSGGQCERYYRAMKEMKRNIDEDDRNGVMAIYHDESHFNKYLSELREFKELSSSYCMVEQPHLQKEWGIDGLTKKIIALAKNHSEMRS